MHALKSIVLSAAMLWAAAPTALAGTVGAFEISNAPEAPTVVVVSEKVTYAKPDQALTTFVAFNVGSGDYLLRNKSRNTLNNITVEFIASVTDVTEKLKLFDTTNPATYLAGLSAAGCTLPAAAANPLVITCQLNQLKTGATFLAPFTVFYEAPVKVTQDPSVPDNGDADGTDKVKLDIRIVYAEGTSGKNPPPNSSVDIKDGTVAVLGTDDPKELKSALAKVGGTFSTGNKGIPNALLNDLQATTVVFSPLTSVNFSTVQILETPDNTDNKCTQLGFFKTCYTTLLLAPGVLYTTAGGAYLTETIRVSKANLVAGAASKADTLIWWYTPTNSADEPIGPTKQINLCATGPVPDTSDTATPTPCQTKPGICYKSSDAPTPDLVDICVWEFINRANGRVNSYP